MIRELCETKEEFEELVQRNLKIECGMDFGDVIDFLKEIMKIEAKNTNDIEREIGLRSIRHTLKEMTNYISK